MVRKSKPSKLTRVRVERYDAMLTEMVRLLEAARRMSARAINAVITTTYWEIGRRIVEAEQSGKDRADYGEKLLKRLASDLTKRFGRGFSWRNLYQMRGFYLAYPEILQTSSAKSSKAETLPVLRKNQVKSPLAILQTPSAIFPLPWSHYVHLLSVENPLARTFYETEALRGGWTVKQLDRQIDSSFYERTALSRNKVAMLTKHNRPKPEDHVTAEEEIKHPLVLEFLGLKDEYSESDLEEALILELEAFLLELGNDFAFIGRQRRLRIGGTWYRIDLLLFHRRLRCLVIIDLKTGKLTHGDVGQMNMYCNYAREHWKNPDENPPVGLILSTQKNDALAHYSLEGLPNKVMAAQYKTALPDEKLLAAELEKTRKLLESRTRSKTKR
jgi:predicted nuclease of restriction endonuclease-like (RecB) superfamily